MPACEQTSSLPGEPETPTAPTTSSPALIGSPPDSASTRVYCREPTEFGSSIIRLVKAAEGWLNVRAVYALRSAPSGVCRPEPSPRSMTMGNPSRSTTTTETLKPMLSHLVSAALAMACAIASGIFFWVTRPCAPAADDSATVTATLARPLRIDDMSYPPWPFRG